MLVVHSKVDQELALVRTGRRPRCLVKDMQLVVVERVPLAIAWRHADRVNTALLDFLRKGDEMAEKKAMVIYAALYGTVEAALADLDAIEQLHKDRLIGQYDAAVIDQGNGKPHVVKRKDRPQVRVIPEWFGAGLCPTRSSMRRLTNSGPTRPHSSRLASQPSRKDSTRRLRVRPNS